MIRERRTPRLPTSGFLPDIFSSPTRSFPKPQRPIFDRFRGSPFLDRFRPPFLRPRTEVDRAADEYASAQSPYAGLQDYLLNRPVFDRGTRPSVQMPQIRRLDRPDFTARDQKRNYARMLQQQRRQDQAASQERTQAIDALKKELGTERKTDLGRISRNIGDTKSELEQLLAGLKTGVAEDIGGTKSELQELIKNIESGVGENLTETKTDLTAKIDTLQGGLGTVKENIAQELEKQKDTLTEADKTSADNLQGQIDGLNQEFTTLSDDIKTETGEQTDLLREEREQLITDLNAKITDISGSVEGLPITDLETKFENLQADADAIKETSSDEKKALSEQIEALKESLATAEGTTQADIQTAIDTLRQEVTGQSAEQISALQTQLEGVGTQRAADIQAALDPAVTDLQTQIETLRGEIPQQQEAVDVEALRKQITDEIMGQMPTAPTPTPTPEQPPTVTAPSVVQTPELTPSASISPQDIMKMAVGLNEPDLQYDMNNDGRITSADALAYVKQNPAQPPVQTPTPVVEPVAAMPAITPQDIMKMAVGSMTPDLQYDMNSDGRITSADALAYVKQNPMQAPVQAAPTPVAPPPTGSFGMMNPSMNFGGSTALGIPSIYPMPTQPMPTPVTPPPPVMPTQTFARGRASGRASGRGRAGGRGR